MAPHKKRSYMTDCIRQATSIFFAPKTLVMDTIPPKKVQDYRLFQGKLPHKLRFRSEKNRRRLPYICNDMVMVLLTQNREEVRNQEFH